MRFFPMQPSPFDSSGATFTVFCVRCGGRVSSADVDCDMDGKPGDFYCQPCVASATLDAGLVAIPYV